MNQLQTIQPTVSNFELLIGRANLADTTKRQYTKAIANAVAQGVNLADSNELANYAATLPKSSRAFLKSAIRLWASDVERQANGQSTPDRALAVLSVTQRFKALNDAIQVPASKGTKKHTWLSKAEISHLYDVCNDDTNRCRRDKVVIAVLVGCGLRRDELQRATFADIEEIPVGDSVRAVLSVVGKGNKARSIPLRAELAVMLAEWRKLAGPGAIARSVNKADKIGGALSSSGIFNIIRAAGQAIGKPGLAPHDLRRSFAQLGLSAGVPITQISKLLGHSNVAVTQKYLDLDLNLDETISDFIPVPTL